MQFLSYCRPAEEEGVHPAEREVAETSAFIEAQLRTGVLLAAEWGDELHGKIPRLRRYQTAVSPAAVAHGRS
jgi:hypothetical protein